jgi:hypothetical protein
MENELTRIKFESLTLKRFCSMKKHRLKNYLKLGILLFGISIFFISCEKDNSHIEAETQNADFIHKLSLNDFSSRIVHNNNYDKLQSYFNTNKQSIDILSQNRIEQGDDITVLTDEILLIQKNGIDHYTFKILTNTTGNEFYNLIVYVNNNQEIIASKIFEYLPDDSWLEDTSQPYKGYVSVTNNDIISLDDLFSSRIGNDCIVGVTTEWNCNANNNHPPDSCTAGGSDLIINIEYGPCSDDPNDGNTYIAGDEEVSGGSIGGGGSNGGNNTNNDDTNNEEEEEEEEEEDNSTPVIPLVPKDTQKECNKITNFFTNNSTMQGALNTLANATLTEPNEIALTMQTDGTPTLLNESPEGETSVAIPDNPPSNYNMVSHIHIENDSTKTMSVFSFEDIINYGKICNNNKLDDDVVFFLSTGKGTHFALTLTDSSKLCDFAYGKDVSLEVLATMDTNQAIQSKLLRNRVYRDYYDINNPNSIIRENNTDNAEVLKAFMEFISEADLGIQVFETDENFQSFSPLKLENDQVIRKTCN